MFANMVTKRTLSRGLAVLICGVFLVLSGINVFGQGIGCEAEWDPARVILMHTPGEELFLGVVHPESALFEDTFSLEKAVGEHRKFIKGLSGPRTNVFTVCDLLLKGTEDPNSVERRELIDLARKAMVLDVSKLPPQDQEYQKKKHEETLKKMAPETLVRIIFQRPVVKLKKIGDSPEGLAALQRRFSTYSYNIVADYELKPIMNLYFLRDQMITTKKGVVLGNLRLPQRQWEVEIIRLVLKKMGITPIHEIKNGTLEGGDFLPAGDRVYIGQGVRTNADAIKELMDNDCFGSREVVVVKDRWLNQQEMHLDTHFNIIARDLAVMVEDRFSRQVPVKRLWADVYVQNAGGKGYRLLAKDVDFVDLLSRSGVKVIPVSVADQHAYGINFLTVQAGYIFAVDGVSEKYKSDLMKYDVNCRWLDFSNLKLGYGAAHCTTQVLYREKK